MSRQDASMGRIGYGVAALIAVLLAIVGLALAAFDGAALARAGLVGSAWYLVVVVTGFAAAAFLFGFMTSEGSATGGFLDVQFRFGGAAAVFLLILLTGWAAKPTPPPLESLSGHIVDAKGNDAYVAGAEIRIDLDGKLFTSTSDQHGRFYATVPGSLKGSHGTINLYKDGDALIPSAQDIVWTGETIQVKLPKSLKPSEVDTHYVMIPGATADGLCGSGKLLKDLGDALIKPNQDYGDLCKRALHKTKAGRDYARLILLEVENKADRPLKALRLTRLDDLEERVAWLDAHAKVLGHVDKGQPEQC